MSHLQEACLMEVLLPRIDCGTQTQTNRVGDPHFYAEFLLCTYNYACDIIHTISYERFFCLR